MYYRKPYLLAHIAFNRRWARAILREASRRGQPNHQLAQEARRIMADMDEMEANWTTETAA